MKLLFLFCVLCSVSYVLATAPPAQATVIDLSPQPVFGDVIDVEKNLERSLLDEISGSIFGGLGTVRPKEDKLPFPDFRTETDFFDDEKLRNRALPFELTDKVKFESPESVKPKLENKGVLAHVGCGKATAEGRSETDVLTQPGQTTFSASDEYGQLLLHSRFWQSIFVPDQGSDLNFTTSEPVEPNIPQHFADCLTASGVSGDATDVQSQTPQTVSLLGGVLDNITNFLKNILVAPGQSTAVNIKIQQVKYLPGETQLKDQTVGEHGFLNFFKPQEIPFSKQGDQKEPIKYQVGDNEEQKGVNYSGAASVQSGYIDLIRSLYPAELLPQPQQ